MLTTTASPKLTPEIKKVLVAYFLLTIAYVVSGKLGLMLALPPGYTSPIFPPAGIAVAAALIGGRSTLPWTFLGSLLLNIWVGYSAGHQINVMSFTVALIIAIASMLQAAAGGWGLRRVIGYPASLDNGTEVMNFLLLAPVICLISASLSVSSLLTLGIIESASFATNWAAWWVGDTLGVVVMLPLVMTLAGEPRALWRSRITTVTTPILLAFALFVVIFLRASQWEYNDSLTEFRQLSQQAVNQVQTKLEEQEFLLEQTAGLFIHDVNGNVTRDEFQRFVGSSLRRFTMIQALEWAPEVDAAHRETFEKAQREDFPGYEIRERNAAGQLQRASNRSAFYPVTFVEPLSTNEPAVGFDLASNPKRQEAINKTKKSGITVASAPVKLVQEHENQSGLLLLLAVNPRDNKSAIVLTVLRIGDFMDKLLRDLRPMIYTRLIDLDEQKPIYDNFIPGSQPALYERSFEFGTRHYRLETSPTPAYFMQHHGWQSWSVLAAGIMGTGLLGSLLLLGTGYTARIKIQVEDRTRKLTNESEKNLALLHNASDGIHILDTEGNVIEASDSFCTMLGYTRDEVIGMNVSRWDAKLTDAERNEVIRQQFAKQERTEFETQHRRKDGTIFDVEVSGFPLVLDGKPVLFNSSRDISKRKHLEEVLKESELRYRTVANYTSDWEYWIMPDNTFRYISPSSEQICGYTPDEFYADPQLLTRIIHPDDLHLYTGHIHYTSTHGEAEPIDFRIQTKGGEWRWISHVCRPVYDPMGQPIGRRSSNRDITDRKAAEEQIRNLAFYDALTQLPNRRLLNDRLGQTMAASNRNGCYAALMFLDLDNFKPLNDTYGHGVGDLLLIEVAKRISGCVREVDTVARLGGDEFVVMLSELAADKAGSTTQAEIVAEKIRVSLAEPYLLTIQQEDNSQRVVEHHCTSSIGVVVFINHETSSDDLLKFADKAMYQAKEDGRNLIRFFDPQGSSDVFAVNQSAIMLRLNWHESYNCGESTIDQEHRKLFDLANTLIAAAFTRHENSPNFDSAMDKLLAHVVRHFAHEEAILARHHYAELDDHKLAHKLLIVHALHLRDKANAGLATIGELVNFLADEVVAQHMLKEDHKFKSLFIEDRPL